jgi:hypothetical protein
VVIVDLGNLVVDGNLGVRPGVDVIDDHSRFADAGGEFNQYRKRSAACMEFAKNGPAIANPYERFSAWLIPPLHSESVDGAKHFDRQGIPEGHALLKIATSQESDSWLRCRVKLPIGWEYVTRSDVLSEVVPIDGGIRGGVNPIAPHPQDGNRLRQRCVIAAQEADRCALRESKLHLGKVDLVEDHRDFT